ncbi:MAG: response regulator [Xenococcaceae cyanobacterium MO_207.B15]|nr:response regulator [Xenococcaceae cyanobacterium MO_207.B15]
MQELKAKLIYHEINETSSIKVLQNCLLEIKRKSLSGSLKVHTNSGLRWILNYRVGRLSWFTGGSNFQERWQRYMDLFCPNIQDPKFKEITSGYSLDKECNVLLQLQGNKFLNRKQLTSLMESVAQEILFDVIQYTQNTSKTVSYELNPNDPGSKLGLLLPLTDIEPTLQASIKAWENWQNAGLSSYSPNLFPVIQQPQILEKYTSKSSFNKISSLIDGTLSLRGLAAKSNWDLVKLTQYIVKMVELDAIAITKNPAKISIKPLRENKTSDVKPRRAIAPLSQQPLVACVDDSPLICETMRKIILKKGYRFISIQEPLKVVATLLKQKPDFIFLDLLMPIINGYEICSQLRKAPNLKNVPIVILTAKDGLVDRMRAKMVNSTEFMSKPIEEELVIKILDKYLTIRR